MKVAATVSQLKYFAMNQSCFSEVVLADWL